MQKRFISADSQLNDAFSLGLQVLDDNFIPDLVIGILRGGVPIAISIHELLRLSGHDSDYTTVRASSYTGINQQTSVAIQGLELLHTAFPQAKNLLLVDDVFDSGKTLETIVNQLQSQPFMSDIHIRIATTWFKPKRNVTSLTPNYCVHETDDWLVFPHELCGLTPNELFNDKPEISNENRSGILAYNSASKIKSS